MGAKTLAKGLQALKDAAIARKLGGTQAERMARAAEQGYDLTSPLYRGTKSNEAHQGNFWSYDPEYANLYAASPSKFPMEDAPNVIKGYGQKPYKLSENPADRGAFENMIGAEDGSLPYHLVGSDSGEISYLYADDLANWLEQTKGIKPPLMAIDERNGRVAVKSYKDGSVRSVNAEFDPEKTNSPDLLASVAGAMPYAGATAAALAGATGSQEAEAGPLQTLGRAAPYLTSAALGGAAALQSGDAEAGKLDALGRAAPYLATGALGAAMMTPQDTQAYNDYIRDEMEARTAADKFAQMRGSKAGYWEARRQELLDMVNGLGEMANNVALPALDKPLQGYLGLAGTAGALAQGQGLQQALMQGANIARQPVEQTTYNMGGAVTDTLSPYTTPEAAAAAGALTNAGIQMLSPI
jgi:hypothetical protein